MNERRRACISLKRLADTFGDERIIRKLQEQDTKVPVIPVQPVLSFHALDKSEYEIVYFGCWSRLEENGSLRESPPRLIARQVLVVREITKCGYVCVRPGWKYMYS